MTGLGFAGRLLVGFASLAFLAGCVAGTSLAPSAAPPLPASGRVAVGDPSVDPSMTPASNPAATPAAPAAPATASGCSCPCAASTTPGAGAIPVSTVKLGGRPFFVRATTEPDIRRCSGAVVAPETVVDGLFLSPQQCWDEGAVWWEEMGSGGSGDVTAAADRWLEIDLAGTYTLRQAIVQADNNDAYLLSYRDPATGAWLPLWTVPPAYSFGMATRPDPADDTKRQTLPRVVTTDAVRLAAYFGDGMYSVSEIQLFGEPSRG
jgi:hypothetical protein